MGKKSAYFLVFWFVLVASVTALVYLPINYWQSFISKQVPNTIHIKQLNGHWWDGQVGFSTPALQDNVLLSWSFDSLFKPIHWNIQHNKFRGFGLFKVDSNHFQLWVDSLSLDADTFNGLMRKEKVALQGQPMQVERWYVEWSWHMNSPSVFRGKAYWNAGEVSYPVGRSLRSAHFSQWFVEGKTQDGMPEVSLQSAKGAFLAGLRLQKNAEIEVTIMPEMIEALGQRWNGSREYPAFVMIQPLPQI